MTKDELIAELRKALKPLAEEPLKDEMPHDHRLCDLNDTHMDEVILAARKAIDAQSDERIEGIH